MLCILLLLVTSLNAWIVGSENDWIFDERHNLYIHNKPTNGLYAPDLTKNIFADECKQCPPINSTDCARLQQDYRNRSVSDAAPYLLEPKKDLCFPPRIFYYGGLGCLMARFSCQYANLFIDGAHVKTREHKLWDLRMPYKGTKYYHHRSPYYGISLIAQCTPQEQWILALGVRPYSEEKIIVEHAYCLP